MKENFKEKFCEFLIEENVLLFGDFITKSGRKSPYFLNFAEIYENNSLKTLAKFYNEVIESNGLVANCFYGPAYKGIPLSLACALEYPKNVNYCFNRKEIKTYGDKGAFVGKKISSSDKIILFDDVITAGTSIRQSIELIEPTGAKIIACVLGVDRQEKGIAEMASKEITKNHGIPVYSLITIKEIIKIAEKKNILTKEQKAIILEYVGNNES